MQQGHLSLKVVTYSDRQHLVYSGLQYQAAEEHQQGQSWHNAKRMLVSNVSEPSLAALQQQHVIDLLKSVTLYLQRDIQHMQHTSEILMGCKQKGQMCSWMSCHFAAIDKLSNAPRSPWR